MAKDTATATTYTIHKGQMLLFDPWKYDLPFQAWRLDCSDEWEDCTPYEDVDQRLGGNDNPYPEVD